MLAALRRLTKEQIVRLPGVSEGLENRLYDAILPEDGELLTAVKNQTVPFDPAAPGSPWPVSSAFHSGWETAAHRISRCWESDRAGRKF